MAKSEAAGGTGAHGEWRRTGHRRHAGMIVCRWDAVDVQPARVPGAERRGNARGIGGGIGARTLCGAAMEMYAGRAHSVLSPVGYAGTMIKAPVLAAVLVVAPTVAHAGHAER